MRNVLSTLFLLISINAFAYNKVCPTPYTTLYSVVYEDNGKMGVVNEDGYYVLPPVYDNVELNALGDVIRGKDGKLKPREDVERYNTLRNVVSMVEYYHEGDSKDMRWLSLAFAVDNKDCNANGISRVHVFDLIRGAELLQNQKFYTDRMEILPCWRSVLETEYNEFREGSWKPVTKLFNFDGQVDSKLEKWTDKHIRGPFFIDKTKIATRPGYIFRPVFYYFTKKGEKIYFDRYGRTADSFMKIWDMDNPKGSRKVFMDSYNVSCSVLNNDILSPLCKSYNNRIPQSHYFISQGGQVISDDSVLQVIKIQGKYGVRKKGYWDSSTVLTADTVSKLAPNFYVFTEQGYYRPFSIDYRGRGSYPSKVSFETFNVEDGMFVFQLSSLDGLPISPVFEMVFDSSGRFVSDNRYEIPDERLAIALHDDMMRGLIYGAKGELLESSDRRKARQYYKKAYELTNKSYFSEKEKEISSNLTAQREERDEELRVAAEEARIAWAGLAASLQSLGNTLSQVQQTRKAPRNNNRTVASNRSTASAARSKRSSTVTFSSISSNKTSNSKKTSTRHTTAKNNVYTTKCGTCRGTGRVKCWHCGGKGTCECYGHKACHMCRGSLTLTCSTCRGKGTTTHSGLGIKGVL